MHVLMLRAIIVVVKYGKVHGVTCDMPNLGCGTFRSSTKTKTAIIYTWKRLLYHACRQIYRLLTNAYAKQTELVYTPKHLQQLHQLKLANIPSPTPTSPILSYETKKEN